MSFLALLAAGLRAGRYSLLGTEREAGDLFGLPLPALPPGEDDGAGGVTVAVEHSQPLREAFAACLVQIVSRLRAGRGGAAEPAGDDAERVYEDLLAEACGRVLLADRREGLDNLFWLAHSADIAAGISRHFAREGVPPHLRYQIHPLLSGLLARALERATAGLPRPQQRLLDFRRGLAPGRPLTQAIIHDQLSLTETDPRQFDPERVLVPQNSRFRIGAAAFAEITGLLRERLAAGLASGEPGLERRVLACAPEGAPVGPERELDRVCWNEGVRAHLLRDFEGLGAALTGNRRLRGEKAPAETWGEFLDRYFEVVDCLRRAEAIAALRRGLVPVHRGLDHRETREKYLEGRLYRFTAHGQITSSLRTATLLFADLRDFTRTAEGPISERDLTRELYEIFDPAALVIRRFGGRVDKYLGDGLMATFTDPAGQGSGALAAVRTAVAMQQLLGRMRRGGSTGFQMGISLHCGRVNLARFLRDEREVEETVIGRHVNLAGRLAGSGVPGGAPRVATVGGVGILPGGGLVNRGIAASGPLLERLRGLVPLEAFRDGEVRGWRWFDRDLHLWLHFGYVGDAGFRGLAETVPVYSLVAASPATP